MHDNIGSDSNFLLTLKQLHMYWNESRLAAHLATAFASENNWDELPAKWLLKI